MNYNYLEELEGLSEKERKIALEILKEYSEKGKSNKLDNLLYEDYKEIPVTIEEFLHNTKYLGKALTNEDGKYTIFPYWEKVLKDIFPTNLETKYNTAVFTGAIGLGKSTIAVIGVLYQLYRMMCLKNPYTHYGLQEVDLITFAFMNITIDAAEGVAWNKCQQMLQKSPWFMERGTLTKSKDPIWVPPQGIELIAGSQSRHILGRAVFSIFIDEISFIQNLDIEKQKKKATELVEAASARMQSRFMKGEFNPTILFLASSKRTEQSYLETFIKNKKINESKTTLVIDEPQWVIRTDKDSKRKFKVAIGNKFLESEVVPLNATEQDLDIFRKRGYTLLDVPMGYYENFIDNLDIALTDIAGISTTSSMKYISGARLVNVQKAELKNLFIKDVIEVGNSPQDTAQYYDFIDIERIDRKLLDRPMFVHFDMSLTGDKTGIAGNIILGKKPHQEGVPENKELYYQTIFSVSIKAPKGHQVSFEKNRNFVRWLKQQGFAIKGLSGDTFQSADFFQQMSAEGYNCEVISVDRTKDNVCEPYLVFKNAIYEERIKMYYSPLLTEEIVSLERDSNGKIDHPPHGSKDAADAVCGSLYNASKHAEEFAFYYGEDIQTMVDVSKENTETQVRKQIEIDMQDELNKLFDPIKNKVKENTKTSNDNYIQNRALYYMNGIIV